MAADSSLIYARIVSLNERLIGKFADAGLGSETHRLLDDLAAHHKPPRPCGRCGNAYGGGSSHGPGFCIEGLATRV